MAKEKTKVLIVEDEFLVASLMSRNLERFFGYEICGPVATGEQAIAYAGDAKPHVVLMDIRLASEMTGIEAAHQIIMLYDIPIIFVTGYASPNYIAQCQALNPAAILEKPIGPSEMDTAIKLAVHAPGRNCTVLKS